MTLLGSGNGTVLSSWSFLRGQAARSADWWQHRSVLAAVLVLTALPLLVPDVPPLVDLPGHMARYRVQMDIGHSPALQSFYDFNWSLMGNLGVDLLVIPLAAILGLELAVKLIAITIPVMTVGGLLWVAREAHGRIPPTAFFAAPLAYSHAFHFGFVNFALSMGLAFIAFAFWLRLGRLGRLRSRAVLFVPISILVWTAHAFGWGTLGVMAYSATLVELLDRGISRWKAFVTSALKTAAVAPPMLLMVLWRSGESDAVTLDWFNWKGKLNWLRMALRDRWETLDTASMVLLGLVAVGAAFHKKLGFSRVLAAVTIGLAIVYLLLPRIILGSAYADMRLAPYMAAVAILAVRPSGDAGRRLTHGFAVAALGFFLARTVATTWSFVLFDQSYDRNLTALQHVPRSARLVTFVGWPCKEDWAMSRLAHISGMAVVRRHAFSNDQWLTGARLLTIRYRGGGRFVGDPSQMVTRTRCGSEPWGPINQALQELPRTGFDYVWLVQPPPYDPALTRGLQPIWRSGTSILYRVVDRRPPQVHMRGL